MAKNVNQETEALSKSKAKRTERRKEVAKEKREKLIGKTISIIIIAAIVGVFAVAIGLSVYKAATTTKSISDFSQGLTEEGYIDGVNIDSCITLADYESLVVPMSEVAASAEEVDANIQSTLEANKELVTDTSVTIADGDTVNIDYVGSIDGVEFEGGNSGGTGYDLVIGSGSFIDDFEDQLIGHVAGEEVSVEVTFPEDYSSADLAGKDAVFAVTVNGVYVTPELTDEFVQTYLSETASTAADYRAYVENNFYEANLQEYLDTYFIDNTTVNSYPKSYVKTLKGLLKYNDEYNLAYYNQMFAQYGMDVYQNVWDTRDGIETEADYEKELTERAQESVKTALVYQSLFEKLGLTNDMDSYFAEMTEEYGEEYVTSMKETYGAAYMAQTRMHELVMEYFVENVKVQ